MADKHVDEGKGRVKEAAGSLTGDRNLKNEGKVDQAKATVKDKVDKVADTLSRRNRSNHAATVPEPNQTEGLGGDMLTILIIVSPSSAAYGRNRLRPPRSASHLTHSPRA